MIVARLQINFAKPQQARRSSVWAGLLFAIGAGTSAMAWMDWEAATEDRLAAEAALQRRQPMARAATARTPVAPTTTAKLQNDGPDSRKAQSALNRPWDVVLSALENAATTDVALLVVEAKGDSQVLRVQGEARHMPAVADVVQRLGQQPGIQGVVLVSHDMQTEGAATWLRFALEAQWGALP